MEFASGITVDLKDGNSVEMRREINPFTYRAASNVDAMAGATSNTITTSLGTVLPKTGAGSEYGREQKEALKRKRYATKGTNLEDLPWLLTNRLATEKKSKHFRGMKKGGIASNSSYYVFIQEKDGFDAYPVNDWYGFTPTNVYKTMGFDEAEKQYSDRNKTLSKWFKTHQVAKEKDPDEEAEDEEGKGKKGPSKRKNDFKLLDTEEWDQGHDEGKQRSLTSPLISSLWWIDEEEDEDNDLDDEKGNKNSKKKKKTDKKGKKGTGTNLSDDDEDEDADRADVKKKKPTAKENNEQGEDSDNGDHDRTSSPSFSPSIDLISSLFQRTKSITPVMKPRKKRRTLEVDPSFSSPYPPLLLRLPDHNTVKSSAKYEAKGRNWTRLDLIHRLSFSLFRYWRRDEIQARHREEIGTNGW